MQTVRQCKSTAWCTYRKNLKLVVVTQKKNSMFGIFVSYSDGLGSFPFSTFKKVTESDVGEQKNSEHFPQPNRRLDSNAREQRKEERVLKALFIWQTIYSGVNVAKWSQMLQEALLVIHLVARFLLSLFWVSILWFRGNISGRCVRENSFLHPSSAQCKSWESASWLWLPDTVGLS